MAYEAVRSTTHSQHTATATAPASDLTKLEQGVEQMSLRSSVTAGPETQSPAPPGEGSSSTGKSKKKKVSGAERRRRQKEKAEAGPRFPAEIIYHILSFVHETDAVMLKGRLVPEHGRMLPTAALVCSLWRDEAQKLLWDSVFLLNNRVLASFASLKRQATVRYLQVVHLPEVGPRLDGRLVKDVLERIDRLKILTLGGIEGLSLYWLCDERFSQLETLSLLQKIDYLASSRGAQQKLKFPFRLRSFIFAFDWSPTKHPLGFLGPLLETASGFVSLMFHGRPSFTASSFTAFSTKPLALTELSCAGPPNIFELLVPFLRRCTSLKVFEFRTAPRSVLLKAVPSFLERVMYRPPNFAVTETYTYEQELGMLKSGYYCLSKLGFLTVLSGGSEGGLQKLRRECKRRGIFLQVVSPAEIIDVDPAQLGFPL